MSDNLRPNDSLWNYLQASVRTTLGTVRPGRVNQVGLARTLPKSDGSKRTQTLCARGCTLHDESKLLAGQPSGRKTAGFSERTWFPSQSSERKLIPVICSLASTFLWHARIATALRLERLPLSDLFDLRMLSCISANESSHKLLPWMDGFQAAKKSLRGSVNWYCSTSAYVITSL